MIGLALVSGAACSVGSPSAGSGSSVAPVTLRLQVGLTPEELASFGPAIEDLDARHPEWTIVLETVPQQSEGERVTTQLAADDLPDVLRVQGANVQQWIRREAFLDLSDRIAGSALDMADFYPGPLEQFRWRDRTWGIPDTA